MLSYGSVQAQPAAADQLESAQLRARVANIQAALDERAGPVQFWKYGSTIVGYALTSGFLTLGLATHDDDLRLDAMFAAGSIFLDTSFHLLDVYGPVEAHAAARLREQPEASAEQLRAKFTLAEALLVAAADGERLRQSLLMSQILPLSISVVTGVVLAVGFGHILGAVINTVASMLGNEIRVLTQPTLAIDALERYRRDPEAPIVRRSQNGFTWSWASAPTGYGIYGRF